MVFFFEGEVGFLGGERFKDGPVASVVMFEIYCNVIYI